MNKHGEKIFFDDLVQRQEATWWGDRTAAAEVRENRRISLLKDMLDPKPGAVILEIGCGVGNLTSKLASTLPECKLLGADISSEAVKIAKNKFNRPNVWYYVGDCCDLSFIPEKVDYIVGRSIMHHMPNLEQLVVALHNTLQDKGKIFFSEPNPRNPHTYIVSKSSFLRQLDQWSPDEQPLSVKELKTVFCRNGLFENLSIKPYDFVYPAFPLSVARLVDRLNPLFSKIPLIKNFAGSLIISANKA